MEQLLTANVATNLYWLGRYLERVETTLLEINKAYDKIIDVDKKAGSKLYKKFGIKLKYKDSKDFLIQAIRGEHAANLATVMHNARENTIISRSNIDLDAFGEIIELESLFKSIDKSPLPIDYKDIDHALSLIREIWGAQAKRGHRKCSDYFLRLGKLIEEVDYRVRFHKDEEMTDSILKDINSIFKLLAPELKLKVESCSQEENIMDTLAEYMNKLIILD